MANYYIVSRNGKNYDLISISKDKLEEIDKYTLNFNNKEELINDINSNGYSIDKNSDIFIVSEGNGKIKDRDILYKNERNNDILTNIDLSLNGNQIKGDNVFNKCLLLSKNYPFSKMLYSKLYPIYKEFIDIIKRSKNTITFNRKNMWLANNYNNYRDICVLLNDYDSLVGKDINLFLRTKNDLSVDRTDIFNDLKNTLSGGFGQLSMTGGPDNFISITSVNPSIIPKNSTLKGSKIGSIKEEANYEVIDHPEMALSVNTKKYQLDMDSIRKINVCYRDKKYKDDVKRFIFSFLTDEYYMPNDSIRHDSKEFYINFDAFGYDYTEDEKDELSSLLSQNMLSLLDGYKRTCRLMGGDNNPGSSDQLLGDRVHYEKELRRYLNKYSDTNSKSFNKIFRFCQVQKEVIDNTKGKKR